MPLKSPTSPVISTPIGISVVVQVLRTRNKSVTNVNACDAQLDLDGANPALPLSLNSRNLHTNKLYLENGTYHFSHHFPNLVASFWTAVLLKVLSYFGKKERPLAGLQAPLDVKADLNTRPFRDSGPAYTATTEKAQRAGRVLSIFVRWLIILVTVLACWKYLFLARNPLGHLNFTLPALGGIGVLTGTSNLDQRTRPLGCLMDLPQTPLPVHHLPDKVIFHNTPNSQHRPANQFNDCLAPIKEEEDGAVPLVLITVTHNARAAFLETALNIRSQSLRNLRWIIVDDYSNDPDATQRLEEAAALDKRIHLVQNTGEPGVVSARNQGLSMILSDSRLGNTAVIMLDDDDLFELNALEKCVWMLATNPDWSLVSFYWNKYGAINTTEFRGVHLGAANYFCDNFVAGSAAFRLSEIKGCRYDPAFKYGGEDWDFWLCLAENGHWGGLMPEVAFWYRANPPEFREKRWTGMLGSSGKDLKQRIHAKHPRFQDPSNFPIAQTPSSSPLERVPWNLPFVNKIPATSSMGSIMVVLPWLFMGGADIGALRQIEVLAKAGYRVTVVCTLYKPPVSIELQPWAMQWTHDIHVLPVFLRPVDHPRYIKYLAESRSIETIFFSNSMLLYDLLPALREQLPSVTFVDYLHNEVETWKHGGYPQYSLLNNRYLDRTLTCSEHMKDWLIERGVDEKRINVVRLGVDLEKTKELGSADDKIELRKRLYGVIDPSTTIILSVARIDPQKRPLLVPDIVQNLLDRGRYHCGEDEGDTSASPSARLLMVMVGGGPLEEQLKAKIHAAHLQACFLLTGTQIQSSVHYQAADLFLLPSETEGISVSVNEAMAAGLPIISTHAGALPEQISAPTMEAGSAGILVKGEKDQLPEAYAYADAVLEILRNIGLYRQMSSNGLIRVRYADYHLTLQRLLPELQAAKMSHSQPRSTEELSRLNNPAAELAIQVQLEEQRASVDLHDIQSRLATKQRETLVGQRLQLHCGEDKSLTSWLDGVEEATHCEGEPEIDKKAVQASAMFQCGAWCIWDLRNPEPVGWSFTGHCFHNMHPGECKEWWHTRPFLAFLETFPIL